MWRVLWLIFILVAQRAVCCLLSCHCQVLPRAPLAAMASARLLHRTSFFCLLKREKTYRRTYILRSRANVLPSTANAIISSSHVATSIVVSFFLGLCPSFLGNIPGVASCEKRGPQFHAVPHSSRCKKESGCAARGLSCDQVGFAKGLLRLFRV